MYNVKKIPRKILTCQKLFSVSIDNVKIYQIINKLIKISKPSK